VAQGTRPIVVIGKIPGGSRSQKLKHMSADTSVIQSREARVLCSGIKKIFPLSSFSPTNSTFSTSN
jgi:hypothetical protein